MFGPLHLVEGLHNVDWLSVNTEPLLRKRLPWTFPSDQEAVLFAGLLPSGDSGPCAALVDAPLHQRDRDAHPPGRCRDWIAVAAGQQTRRVRDEQNCTKPAGLVLLVLVIFERLAGRGRLRIEPPRL